ncbi:MAG: hypothetical protein ACRCZ0_01245 [Cetobacterium sp.]
MFKGLRETIDDIGEASVLNFEFKKDENGRYWFSDDGEEIYSKDWEVLIKNVRRFIRKNYKAWYCLDVDQEMDSF